MVSKYNFNSHPRRDGTHGERAFVVSAAALTSELAAGVGVRIFLPMIGMMGIDWAYGFDKINGSTQYSGSQFHFIIGQEF